MNEYELYLRQGGPISYRAVILRGPIYTYNIYESNKHKAKILQNRKIIFKTIAH